MDLNVWGFTDTADNSSEFHLSLGGSRCIDKDILIAYDSLTFGILDAIYIIMSHDIIYDWQ